MSLDSLLNYLWNYPWKLSCKSNREIWIWGSVPPILKKNQQWSCSELSASTTCAVWVGWPALKLAEATDFSVVHSEYTQTLLVVWDCCYPLNFLECFPHGNGYLCLCFLFASCIPYFCRSSPPPLFFSFLFFLFSSSFTVSSFFSLGAAVDTDLFLLLPFPSTRFPYPSYLTKRHPSFSIYSWPFHCTNH